MCALALGDPVKKVESLTSNVQGLKPILDRGLVDG